MQDRSVITGHSDDRSRTRGSDGRSSDLKVIGVDDGALVVSSGDGGRYRVAIDEALYAALRTSSTVDEDAPKVAPRDIQAHVRAGMSADEVAAVTGAPLDYIRKFEGPVLAEREYMVESALNVAVHTPLDSDGGSGSTFGAVIRDRLSDLEATGERWASWKEAGSGWIVKLSFVAAEIDHDARWQYEPKRSALAPLNSEARTLSQQGELPGGLIPRLRAVVADERSADSSRFDSGAFDVMGRTQDSGSVARLEAVPFSRTGETSHEASEAAISRAPVAEVASSHTADLLEALRRRRGERESAAWSDAEQAERGAADDRRAGHPSAGGVRLVDVPLATFDDDLGDGSSDGGGRHGLGDRGSGERGSDGRHDQTPTAPQPFVTARASRKGRATMPSWDEIVFGAKSDDDPA
ncbi:MAG: hypothetical protein RI885_1791 [Actinomycetota bacterium]